MIWTLIAILFAFLLAACRALLVIVWRLALLPFAVLLFTLRFLFVKRAPKRKRRKSSRRRK